MDQRQKPNRGAKAVRPARKRAPFQLLDEQLNRILFRLADLLLRRGYGYQRISKLTKAAYVNAAQEIGKRERSRTSIARIAALTGLTRIDVSKLIKADQAAQAFQEVDLNRATRVAHGWAHDRKFSDEQGRPLPLDFAGRSGFASLVRRYSGDIPARAMLAEMKRLGMIRHDSDDVVSLSRQEPAPDRTTIEAIRAIAPWVDLISADGSARAGNLTSTTQQLRIYFESESQILASIRDLESKRRSFVSSVEQLATSTRAKSGYELTVSIAVAAAQVKRLRRQRRTGARRRHEG